MSGGWSRFTAEGGDEVERRIEGILTDATAAIRGALSPCDYRCLLLIGGYGRGEGGVERVDGRDVPHNNLDLLLVVDRLRVSVRRRLTACLDPLLWRLSEKHGIGIDLGVVDAAQFQRRRCRVMTYDLRFAHKTLLGDAEFVSSLPRFRSEDILRKDMRDLLVNRGTLLVANDLLLERGDIGTERHRLIVRHVAKAVIGYGDALLFFLGDYHWSYREKQRRMRARRDVPENFRRLYDEASEFRMNPCYERFSGRDPVAWMEQLRSELAPIHLRCEAARLAVRDLSWECYPDLALRHDLLHPGSARELVRKALHLLRPGPARRAGTSRSARLAARSCGLRDVLPIFFPKIAYHLEDGDLGRCASATLGVESTDLVALRRAYLACWGDLVDANFPAVLHRVGLSLGREACAQ